MYGNIIQLNQDLIHTELKELVTWILVKRDDAVWLSLRKKRINTSD